MPNSLGILIEPPLYVPSNCLHTQCDWVKTKPKGPHLEDSLGISAATITTRYRLHRDAVNFIPGSDFASRSAGRDARAHMLRGAEFKCRFCRQHVERISKSGALCRIRSAYLHQPKRSCLGHRQSVGPLQDGLDCLSRRLILLGRMGVSTCFATTIRGGGGIDLERCIDQCRLVRRSPLLHLAVEVALVRGGSLGGLDAQSANGSPQ